MLYRVFYAECPPGEYEEGETEILNMIAECNEDIDEAVVFWGVTMEYNVVDYEEISEKYPIDIRLCNEDFIVFQPPDQRIDTTLKEDKI